MAGLRSERGITVIGGFLSLGLTRTLSRTCSVLSTSCPLPAHFPFTSARKCPEVVAYTLCTAAATLPGMTTWSTPAERRLILVDHRSGVGVSKLARSFGYSRSGIYNMLLTASIEKRERERRERLQTAYGSDQSGPRRLFSRR